MRFFLLLLGIPLAVLTGCTEEGRAARGQDGDITIPVVRLSLTDTIVQQEYVADIQASRNVEIRAKVPGFIKDILVDEGRDVKKGQLLFTIDDAEYRTQLSKAEAALLNAKAEAAAAKLERDRIRLLVDKNIISKTEYELANARLRAAEAKVAEAESMEEIAKIRLSYTSIRSPFDGVIDRIPEKPGSLVDQGALLTTLSDLEKVYAYFSVSEDEYLRYLRQKKAGKLNGYDDIRLILADGSAYPFHGKVEATESEFDKHTGSIAFRATFVNPDRLLKHGASGKVLLETAISNALMIPQKAVMEIQDKSFVFVVDANNTVKMKSFDPKVKLNEFVVVQSGLSDHDTIVYEGILNIRDGSKIKPEYVQLDGLKPVGYRQ